MSGDGSHPGKILGTTGHTFSEWGGEKKGEEGGKRIGKRERTQVKGEGGGVWFLS